MPRQNHTCYGSVITRVPKQRMQSNDKVHKHGLLCPQQPSGLKCALLTMLVFLWEFPLDKGNPPPKATPFPQGSSDFPCRVWSSHLQVEVSERPVCFRAHEFPGSHSHALSSSEQEGHSHHQLHGQCGAGLGSMWSCRKTTTATEKDVVQTLPYGISWDHRGHWIRPCLPLAWELLLGNFAWPKPLSKLKWYKI